MCKQMWRNVLKYEFYKGFHLGNPNISDPSHQRTEIPKNFFEKENKQHIADA